MRKKRDLFIEMDATDSSITFSDDLCKDLKFEKGVTYIYTFLLLNGEESVNGKKTFAFKRVKEAFAKVVACEILSLNPKLDTYGMMATNPTVNYMFYAMGIDEDKKKFSVKKEKLLRGGTIYKIMYDGNTK